MGMNCLGDYMSPHAGSPRRLTPARMRIKEERRKIIRSLESKYQAIDDHESTLRKFVLIK